MFSFTGIYMIFSLLPLNAKVLFLGRLRTWNNDKCDSLCDDIISWVCVVNISINGNMQPFMRQLIFQGLKCDNLWFTVYFIASCSRNLEIFCKVIRIMLRFHVKSLIGQVNLENLHPSLQGWGHMWNILVLLKMLVTTLSLHLYYLISPLPMDSDVGEPQPPLITDDTSCLSLTFDSKLPIDMANLGLICILQWAIPP